MRAQQRDPSHAGWRKPSRLIELAGGARTRVTTEIAYLAKGLLHRSREFTYNGKTLRFHAHRYNTTWANERTVELPIVIDAIRDHPGGRVLEVGNVLGHYGVVGHQVVDKYERALGVANVDILEFTSDEPYDLIVSISTLEHIGFEEEEFDPDKPRRVLTHLNRLLRPGGRCIVTFALGYNDALDTQLAAGSLPVDEVRYLRRISRSNLWAEITPAQARGSRWGTPYPKGNAIAVLIRSAPKP